MFLNIKFKFKLIRINLIIYFLNPVTISSFHNFSFSTNQLLDIFKTFMKSQNSLSSLDE